MRNLVGVILLAASSVFPVCAQIDGRITGSVVDVSGAVVPGAEVELLLAGGKKPLLTTRTSIDGTYHFIGVRPGYFDITVDAAGFLKATLLNLSVDPARETSVAQVKLQLLTVAQNVEVSAEAQNVQSSNSEISQTVSTEEIRNLPLLDRDPLGAMQLEAGVVYNGNSNTVINGLRTSYSDMTLDGINIQDNYIRDNALDYSPNKPLLSQVRQMTVISSNGNAAMSGGATETAFTTPSGTNQIHGEAFWYNRNNAFSANDWFNNQSGVALPFLNQNQMGASIGGPIFKDKLFYYGTYEAVRAHQQSSTDLAIPTALMRTGLFQYRNSAGTLQQTNLLTLRGISIDPVVQGLLAQVPTPDRINNDLVGDGLNTRGYRFNQVANETRDNLTARLDYAINTQQAVSASFSWNRDNSYRPDAENDYSVVPKITNPTNAALLATSWRWTPSSRMTNEVRAGFNLTYAYFLTSQKFGSYILGGLAFSDPVNEFQPQGRNTDNYTLTDDAAYQRGRHYIQFGFHGQQVKVRSYDDSGVVPTYSLSMGQGQVPLTTRNLPGISSAALGVANGWLATMGGYLDGYSQTFNVTTRTSGFVPNAPFLRHFQMTDYALYLTDKWKLSPRLTVNLGLRYNLPGVVDEANSLELQPVFSGSAVQTLLNPNTTLNFAGGSAGRPWYHRDKKDFGPNVGVAWDVFGNGKTAVRGAYSIFYVNDQAILAPENMLEANAGLQGISATTGLSGTVGAGVPPIPEPVYQVPLTTAYNYQSNPFNVVGSVDPNLHRPYVQQYSVGIQQEFKGTVFEARYVGNHTVGAYRAFDFNQVNINAGGFLQDFLKAQNNGLLSLKANGTFNPAYTSAVVGSQPLPVFNQLTSKGGLSTSLSRSDGNVVNFIETGQPGELAYYYQTNGDNPNNSVPFFANPDAIGADMLTNFSSASYNSLQLEARHRMRSGLSLTANYSFSKVLSDADGDSQTRFQNLLDINNPKLERARANFDLTHMIKASGFFELPFGENHRLRVHHLDRVIGGWTVGAVMVWQSGAPFSITSGYGTLNRAARSYYNDANTSLSGQALFHAVSFHMTGAGPMMVPLSAVNPADQTGAVSGIDATPYAGEIFFNPAAGTLGTLQRRMFDGPWTFDLDLNLLKEIKFSDRHSVELRMMAINALNHATFWAGDQNINAPPFGMMSSSFFASRVCEFGLTYKY
jgi:hypothetical protein